MPGSIHSIGSISMISGNIGRPHYDRRSLNLLAMLLPLSRFGISTAAAEGPPRTIADLMHLLAQVVESRSTFTEVKTIAALTVPLYASGELLYRRPDYLEKVTEQPRPERMVVEGDRLTISTAGEPAREIDLVSQEMISRSSRRDPRHVGRQACTIAAELPCRDAWRSDRLASDADTHWTQRLSSR